MFPLAARCHSRFAVLPATAALIGLAAVACLAGPASAGDDDPPPMDSFYSLNGSGEDYHGRDDLTFSEAPGFTEDRFDVPDAAYLPMGTGYGESTNPAVRTDASFTISAWARLDNSDTAQTVLAQAAGQTSAFSIGYDPTANRWTAAVSADDDSAAPRQTLQSLTAPQLGRWYHLTLVNDLVAQELRFYVDGQRIATVSVPSVSWHTDGPLLVGSDGTNAGLRHTPMTGAIDDIRVYPVVVDDQTIAAQGCTPENCG